MDDNTFKFLSLLVLSCQTVALAYIGVRQQQTHSTLVGTVERLTSGSATPAGATETPPDQQGASDGGI